MKKLTALFLSFFVLTSVIYAQKTAPEISIKFSEKSGFLGMGKARIAKIALSTRGQDKVLTSDNVNAGPLYYFLMRDSGGWKIDEDFILELLPKLTIEQQGKKFSVEPVSPAVQQGGNFYLHLSTKKDLQLHLPMTFTVPIEKKVETAVMNIPKELWPGYKKFSSLLQEGDKHNSGGKLQESIQSYENILTDQALAIFPEFDGVFTKRLNSYKKLYEMHKTQFLESLLSSSTTKEKISSSEEFLGKFDFIAANAAKGEFQNAATSDGASALRDEATAQSARTAFVADSLKQALDEQTIRWIVLGSSAGKIDFKYKYVVETMAYAYLSLQFADTAAPALKATISEDLTARLEKYKLLNSYETFLRVVNSRWVARKPMFPERFLENLAKDTAQFSLPYYSMLKAVESFYVKNYRTAKTEIINVMRKSYAYELTERIDQLRILINTIEKNVPMEVLQRIKDGTKAEERGNNEKAIEHYKDALLIAEDYAPAAFALGKLYDRTGDSYTANNFFQKAVSADSQYYTAYRFLYINFFKNANFKPMADLLVSALDHGNDFFDIHYYLGIAYNGSAQYDLAIQQYERALELNSNSIDANIQAGISYQNMKSYSKAREYFRRAISIDPENQTATDNLKRLDELQKKM